MSERKRDRESEKERYRERERERKRESARRWRCRTGGRRDARVTALSVLRCFLARSFRAFRGRH